MVAYLSTPHGRSYFASDDPELPIVLSTSPTMVLACMHTDHCKIVLHGRRHKALCRLCSTRKTTGTLNTPLDMKLNQYPEVLKNLLMRTHECSELNCVPTWLSRIP